LSIDAALVRRQIAAQFPNGACVLGGLTPPSLLILDEPNNHPDIEAGLRAYDGALLVISHDEAFLKDVGVSRRPDLARTPT
jgi:hypothetical protein